MQAYRTLFHTMHLYLDGDTLFVVSWLELVAMYLASLTQPKLQI